MSCTRRDVKTEHIDGRSTHACQLVSRVLKKKTVRFMQWPVVNTLFQEKNQRHNQKDGSKGNTKIGPVMEVTTSYLHGKYGVEIRIWSLNRDNTHSWVRISHGSSRFMMNLNNNEIEIPEDQLEEYAFNLDAENFCMQIKGKSKTTKKRTCRLFTKR